MVADAGHTILPAQMYRKQREGHTANRSRQRLYDVILRAKVWGKELCWLHLAHRGYT